MSVTAQMLTENIDLTLPLLGALHLTPPFLNGGVVGALYSATFQAMGGSAPVQFSVFSGTLPPGLSLTVDEARREARLGGTPTAAGAFVFALRAVDDAGKVGQRLFTVNVVPCAVALSQEEVSFTSAGGSATVRVLGGCSWQSTTTAPWITLTAAGSALSLTVPAGATVARTATVSVGARSILVRQGGSQSAAPFGSLDVPLDGTVASGSIAVGGWALDDLGVTRVSIYRDSVAPELPGGLVYVGDAVRVRGARPDVEALYPNMAFRDRAGWGFLLLTNVLPNQGNGSFRLHAYAEDIEGYGALLGSRTIVAANATATSPFGAIDTPGQGETIAGTAFVNFGWALTPLPKTIPQNGSTITVIIDGVAVGTVNYGHFRSDVATLFPGLNNSAGAVGFRTIDTTQLADGIHTISWVVTDDAGATEGIGSRYFHVDNTTPTLALSPVTALSSDREMLDASAASVLRSVPGRSVVRIQEMERLTLDLGREMRMSPGCPAYYAGYEIVGDERRALPAGSSLDPLLGTFAWQPGPGFIGTYRLLFTATACDGAETALPIEVKIVRSSR